MPKVVEVTCGYCKGTSSYIVDGCDQRVACKLCGETGKIQVMADLAGNPIACPFCEGKGGDSHHDKKCKVCGGCGWSGMICDLEERR